MAYGLPGSPNREGTARTAGIVDTENSADVVKRAKIIWLIAVAALVFFHVGGSKL